MQQSKIQFRALESCALCKQPFSWQSKKQPRILHCGHTACSNCVKNSAMKNGFLACPQCGQQYSKQVCSNLLINEFYLNMLDNIESTFGKNYVYFESKPSQHQEKQVNILIRKEINHVQPYHMQKDMGQQFSKCKNPTCFKKTDLNFCSEDCQLQFDEMQTENNESYDHNERNGENIFEI